MGFREDPSITSNKNPRILSSGCHVFSSGFPPTSSPCSGASMSRSSKNNCCEMGGSVHITSNLHPDARPEQPQCPQISPVSWGSPGLEKTHPKWSQRIILKWKSNRNINTVTQLIIKQVCMPHVTMFFISFTTSMASPRRVLVFTKYSTGWPRSFSRTLCNLQLAMACPNARGMAFQVCWPPHSPLGTNNLEQVCQILEVSADIKRNNLAEPLSSPLLMVAAWSQYHFGGDLKSWICQKKWNNQLQCTVPVQ